MYTKCKRCCPAQQLWTLISRCAMRVDSKVTLSTCQGADKWLWQDEERRMMAALLHDQVSFSFFLFISKQISCALSVSHECAECGRRNLLAD